MTAWGPFLILWFLSRSSGAARAPAPKPKVPEPGPFHFPPVQPPKPKPGAPAKPGAAAKPGAPGQPAPVNVKYAPSAPSSDWIPYEPVPGAVAARAKQLLSDASVHEAIEKDPAHPGQVVRFLRTTDNPPGHTSVTAWKPRPGTPAEKRAVVTT